MIGSITSMARPTVSGSTNAGRLPGSSVRLIRSIDNSVFIAIVFTYEVVNSLLHKVCPPDLISVKV